MGVTIKDVAKAAGTSVSTVSKVINGHYSISEGTADRVRKVIKELTRADGFRMTTKLLDQKPLPDAIICANNYIAVGCVDALLKKGMKIPEDIGVIAFDDYPFSQIIEPQLTVVDINVRDMGNQAGKFLIDIIKHPNMQVQTYVTTSNIMERHSTVHAKCKYGDGLAQVEALRRHMADESSATAD